MINKPTRPTDLNHYRVTESPNNMHQPSNTGWSMDNNTYDEMTDQCNGIQVSSTAAELTSLYSIPIKGKNQEKCESGKVEGFYDLAGPEDSGTVEGGDYSTLDHSTSNGMTKKPLENDSVYQTLSNEKDSIYNSVY